MAASSLCSSFTSTTSHSQHHLHHRKTLNLPASSFLSREFHLNSASVSKTRRSRSRRSATVASLGGLLGGIFKGNDTGEATRKQYAATVNLINGLEAKISKLSDSELRDKTFELRERAQKGESLDSLLPVSIIFDSFY